MFKIVGRIVARGDKTAGLFIPIEGGLDGVYEIRECLGELVIRRVGNPAMHRQRFIGLDLEGLFAERSVCAITAEEVAEAFPEI